MAKYLRDWLHNLWITLAVVVGVGIVMLVLAKVFYPETLSILLISGKWTAEIATAFKLWPIIILTIVVSAMPKRKLIR